MGSPINRHIIDDDTSLVNRVISMIAPYYNVWKVNI
jgi:hypothetical protein